jgi:hypothetical protein
MRAIDVHEPTICRVVDAVMVDETPYPVALATVAADVDMPRDRLDSLVRVWCGIAGLADILPTVRPTRRYLVTIHDTGNITDDPENIRTILTSRDYIAPRERVEVVAYGSAD